MNLYFFCFQISLKTKSREHYLLNVELNTTMHEVTIKIQERAGLKLFQVSLSIFKNS